MAKKSQNFLQLIQTNGLDKLEQLYLYPLNIDIQSNDLEVKDYISILDNLTKETYFKNLKKLRCSLMYHKTYTDLKEDLKLMQKRIIKLITLKCIEDLSFDFFRIIEDKEVLQFAKKLSTQVIENIEKVTNLKKVNGLNVGYYLQSKAKYIEILEPQKQLNLFQYQLMINLVNYQLDNGSSIIMMIGQQEMNYTRSILNQLNQIHDINNSSSSIWLKDYINELLFVKTLSVYNFSFYLQEELSLNKEQLKGEENLKIANIQKQMLGISQDLQQKFNPYFKRRLRSFSNLGIKSQLDSIIIMSSSGSCLSTLILDLDKLQTKFNQDILRTSVSSLKRLENIILISKEKVSFKLIAQLLDINKTILSKLCIDFQLDESFIKHFVTLILNMERLRHIHLTQQTNLQALSQSSLASLKQILSKDSLKYIIIDSFSLDIDIENLIGLSQNLTFLVLTIKTYNRQNIIQYQRFILELSKKVYNLNNLQVLNIKLSVQNLKHFFNVDPVRLNSLFQHDKDFISIVVDVLAKNKDTLEVWNLFYPIRSAYLPIFTTKIINAALKENLILKVLNNLDMRSIREFYINESLISTDIDGMYSKLPHINSQNGEVLIYDNYRFNHSLTTIMASFIAKLIGTVCSQQAKNHQSVLSQISFDGVNILQLKDILEGIIDQEGVFDFKKFTRDVLKQHVLLQSDIQIVLALLFADEEKIQNIKQLIFSMPNIYEIEIETIASRLKKNTQIFSNITHLSFKGTQFQSSLLDVNSLDIKKTSFHEFLLLPQLQNLNLSYTNIFHAMSDEIINQFCEELKKKTNFKYLGLAQTMITIKNLRKYNQVLSNLPTNLEKLNISYNLILPEPLMNFVFFTVQKIKMTFAKCSSNQINIKTNQIELDSQFQELAQFIVRKRDILRFRQIQFHSKLWLVMREMDVDDENQEQQQSISNNTNQVAKEDVVLIDKFIFSTQCVHEFLINMEVIKLSTFSKIGIFDFNFQLLNAGTQLADMFNDLIMAGCLEKLEYLNLVNVNLQMLLMNKSQMADKLLFLKEISSRCALKELDISKNSLILPTLMEIIIQTFECKTLTKITFKNDKNKWPLNSKQYVDLQRQLEGLFYEQQRKFEIDRLNDIIRFF
ncbi:UNKNOWN [Stylonychia lemnae]|uniref:Uncharacterized protein n=1 Tax=Stylonychia lemnae TaxID=5949 RepID=A0A078B384_STYLE|nr:UNKNOWN [Stylonychia lemnae]|eukprot:CDW87707.1 UNKNOWN [Stylonychia lemnae]